MFEVANIEGGPSIKVYSVMVDERGDTKFLIWDDGQWKWVYADAYGPYF